MKYTLEIPVLVLSSIPSASTRLTVASLYTFPLTVLKSSASATDADSVAEIASIACQDFSLPSKKRDLFGQRITHCEIANTANSSAALMSAEIILPGCHHFNAESALQAPKTSSAFQPCATVMRLTSPQTGESPVPLQNSVSISSARARFAVLSVVCKFASTTRNAARRSVDFQRKVIHSFERTNQRLSSAAPDTPKLWRRRLRCMPAFDVGVPGSGRRVACDRSSFSITSELCSLHVVKPLI